ncbi:MAG: hypothetical protein ACE14S_02765 [Candidatus Bathyarchaeia archaeon]
MRSFKFFSDARSEGKVQLALDISLGWAQEERRITGFFEEHIGFSRFRVPKRLLVPFLVVLAAKVAAGAFVYYSMNIGEAGTLWSDSQRVFGWEQNAVFQQHVAKWPLAFSGWDSAWFLSIVTRGYGFSPQSYAFYPGLPFFGSALNALLRDPMAAVVACAFAFGVLWVPLYQLFAEKHMSRRAALASALLLAFSPYLFLFTTVAYSEGMFLFFTVAAWLLFDRGRVAAASAFGSVAALTRVVGVLVALPMLYGSLRRKNVHWKRNVALSLAPVVALALWFVFCGFTSGDFFAPVHTTEWSSLYSFRTLVFEGIPQRGIQALLAAPYQNPPVPTHWLLPAAVVFALILPLFLLYKAARMDGSLAVYSLANYLGVLAFGALVSTPRFVAVLFPLWIPLTAGFSGSKRAVVAVAAVCAVFYVITLNLWVSFLNGEFVA